MEEKMTNIFTKIKNSFFLAWKGQEQMPIVLWWWGAFSYFVAFIIKKIIDFNSLHFLDIIIALLVIVYYIWHLIVIHRCKPKKPKLSDEEKALLKKQSNKEFWKSFSRKLFLQEPITKWSMASFITVVNLYVIAVFAGYIFN